MFNMKIPKHSYVFSKDFILCCLAEDDQFFYGEILYGRKRMKSVKTLKFEDNLYYKYWELEHMKKINRKNTGGKTGYIRYIIQTKKLYPQYYFQHPVIGDLFRILKIEVIKIMAPKDYNQLNKLQKQIITLLRIKFSLLNQDILMGGSNLLKEKDKPNDFDILINGKSAGIKVSKLLNKITQNKKNRILIGERRYHQRRFHINKKIICPFSIYEKDNFFEIAKIEKLRNPKKTIAKIIDSSESLFSPARYKIKTMEGKDYLLISYFVGHNHLFKEKEIIEFKAPLFQFSKNSIKKQAFVIPIQGSWIDIK